MISDEDIALAIRESRGDRSMAFVRLERVLRRTLHENLEKLDDGAGNEAWTSYYIEYMNHTVASARFCNVAELSDFAVPSHTFGGSIFDIYRDFTASVDNFSMQVRLAAVEHHSLYSVHLKLEDKRKIRHYVDKIKITIEKSNLEISKRDELFKLLGDFIVAVDRDQTGLEYWGAFTVGVAHIIGEAVKELDPIRQWIDSIAHIFGKAQENEPRRLPRPTTKQIEAPTKKLTNERKQELDDDIPF